MGKLIPFRSTSPAMYIDGAEGSSYYLNVRPCPAGVTSLESYPSLSLALSAAWAYQRRHGWRLVVLCSEDGVA